MELKYLNALGAEVQGFSGSIKRKVERDMKRQELGNEVVMEWEKV